MKVVALFSSKGGVGKTAAAVNIAYSLAARGRKTLLVDLDQQGASSFYFEASSTKSPKAKLLMKEVVKTKTLLHRTGYEGLDLLPAHTSYRNFDTVLDGMKRSEKRLAEWITRVGAGYDRVVLDCPPSLSLVAENVFKAADVILVPVVPTTLSQRTFSQLKDFFGESNFKKKKLRPFFSMVDSRKRMHQEITVLMRSLEKRVLFAEIPYSASVEAMGIHRAPIFEFDPKHKAALAFTDLVDELESVF